MLYRLGRYGECVDLLDGISFIYVAQRVCQFNIVARQRRYRLQTVGRRIAGQHKISYRTDAVEVRPLRYFSVGHRLPEVLERAMRPVPKERFPSAQAMHSALDNLKKATAFPLHADHCALAPGGIRSSAFPDRLYCSGAAYPWVTPSAFISASS